MPEPHTMASEAVELAEAGRFAESLVMFDALVQVMPHDASAHEQRAQLLLELDRASEAVASAEQATAIQPEWAIGWLTLGRARLNAIMSRLRRGPCLLTVCCNVAGHM